MWWHWSRLLLGLLPLELVLSLLPYCQLIMLCHPRLMLQADPRYSCCCWKLCLLLRALHLLPLLLLLPWTVHLAVKLMFCHSSRSCKCLHRRG